VCRQVCQEEEFLQLAPMQLVSLIKRDGLNVQEESQVYQAVLKWVRHDEESRYPKMEHILYAVRCQFLTPNFLEQQMNHCDVLRRLPACREYLAKIFKVRELVIKMRFFFPSHGNKCFVDWKLNFILAPPPADQVLLGKN
jgi:hypothetical protein